MPKAALWGSAAVAAIVALGWGVHQYLTPPDNTVRLLFTAAVGDQPLVFDRFNYANPAGVEKFKIRDFRFYLSNIKLHGKEGDYIEPSSYHLARFDNAETSYAVELNNVELSELHEISLSIGVDAAANASIEPRGDLDPNSKMAWNWQIGYKFIILEGGIRVGDQVQPLVYHVGFSENRRDLVFEAPERFELGNGTTIRFTVDLMKIFASESVLDLTQLQKVVLDRDDSRTVADNYRHMINVRW